MFVFSLLIFIGSLGWIYYEPGWEPVLFALSSFSVLAFSESHVKIFLVKKYLSFKACKILISEGRILSDDQELMEIIRSLCLGENLDLRITNLEDSALEKHAKKKVDDKNKRYYLLAQVDRRKKKIALSNEGIKKITSLYRKGYIRCEVENLPPIIRRYISILYSPTPSSTDYPSTHNKQSFDIYSNSVGKGEISFIADIPEQEVQEVLDKLQIQSTQKMCFPYMYSVLDIPRRVFHEYVVPAQVLYGLTTHKEKSENDNYWAPQNWAIGPH